MVQEGVHRGHSASIAANPINQRGIAGTVVAMPPSSDFDGDAGPDDHPSTDPAAAHGDADAAATAAAPLDAFSELVACDPVPLDQAALAIAAHCRGGDVGPAATLAELDRLGAAVREPIPEAVLDLLFAKEGFGPNRGRFADPANSYLDLVVSRRLGIPITLAVVTIEVARRAGLELHGVGMPGHFLVGTPHPGMFIDAFDGRLVDRVGAQQIFKRFESRHSFDDSLLAPTPAPQILLRMLNNLRTLHMRQPGAPSILAVLELLTRLPDCPPPEFIRLGQALSALGRPDEGARTLEAAAERFGGSAADQLNNAALRLWAQLN
ncbi:SirB1 family protein [Candidatus Poriferisodalis sp.]|uniref:SirB1 family protein n=1 Tax=Candidatus Poriferisodalis sp. TaxID=3101277 RepID=UPI003B02DEC0